MDLPKISKREHTRLVGLRLRQLVYALGLKNTEAARDMGISKSNLGNWMRGNGAYPTPYELFKFCNKRNVDTNWIFLGDPSSLPKKVFEKLEGQSLDDLPEIEDDEPEPRKKKGTAGGLRGDAVPMNGAAIRKWYDSLDTKTKLEFAGVMRELVGVSEAPNQASDPSEGLSIGGGGVSNNTSNASPRRRPSNRERL